MIRDVCNAVHYIHTDGIACRDLKPSYILIANENYRNILDKKTLSVEIKSNPITCKVIDFGEAKSRIYQTKSLVATKTRNVQRGTRAFMPPELLTGEIKEASIMDMILGDIWSLGILIFSVINPDLASPDLFYAFFLSRDDNNPCRFN